MSKLEFVAEKQATVTTTVKTDTNETWTAIKTYSSRQQTMGRQTISSSSSDEYPIHYTDPFNIIVNKSLVGSIQITKTDTDKGTKLSGATFEITGPNNYSETKTTNAMVQ